MPTPGDVEGIIHAHWHPDGPHTPESVRAAGAAIDELSRYLARATAPWVQGLELRGADLYHLIGELRSAAGKVDQVLDQLAGRAEQLADDPTLYDDRRDDHLAADTVHEAWTHLTATRGALTHVIGHLDHAHSAASHLGHDPKG